MITANEIKECVEYNLKEYHGIIIYADGLIIKGHPESEDGHVVVLSDATISSWGSKEKKKEKTLRIPYDRMTAVGIEEPEER